MVRRISVLFTLIVVWLSLLGGCKKDSGEAEPEPEAVKTVAEYRAEAEKEINEENMEDELKKLEEAIEQDISQEP